VARVGNSILSRCGKIVLGVCLLAASTVTAPNTAHAGPFTCSGDIYQVQSGQLRIFDPVLSQYVDVGPQNGSYNATGFNTLDNFAYGSQGNNVIRIEDDGTIQTLFNVGFSSFAGDVDGNNIINLDNGTSVRRPITGLPSGGGFGATWTDAISRLFTFHNNTGQIFEIFDVFGAAPFAQLVAQGDPSGNNDGFSCNQAPFPNLPPLAQDDAFTTPVNVAVSGNVLVDNGNGVDEDPENSTPTANTTPIAGPSNGTVVLNADGSFTYTPNTNFIGVDTFEYEISDISGLTATAIVTITIEGTIEFTVAKSQVAGPSPVTHAEWCNRELGHPNRSGRDQYRHRGVRGVRCWRNMDVYLRLHG